MSQNGSQSSFHMRKTVSSLEEIVVSGVGFILSPRLNVILLKQEKKEILEVHE